MKNFIHETLKCLCGVAESEWHLDKFEQSEESSDGSFRNVFGGYRNLVVGSSLEKMVDPCRAEEKSWMCGIGYLSGIVLLFRAR